MIKIPEVVSLKILFEDENLTKYLMVQTEDVEKAIKGKKVLIKPNSPAVGIIVAFILENKAPVEFIQFIKN